MSPPSQEARETEVRVATIFNVEAVVTHVTRSTAGLQPHGTIHITYQDWEYGDGAAGAMIYNPLTPKVGEEIRTYLQTRADAPEEVTSFEVAAAFLSFDPYWAKHQSSSALLNHYRNYLRDLLRD